jgi:hypothetical protein
MKYLILLLFFVSCKDKPKILRTTDGQVFEIDKNGWLHPLHNDTVITVAQPSKILIKDFMLPDSETIIKYQLDGFTGSKTGIFKNVLAGNHVITMCLDDKFSGDNLTNFAKSLTSVTFTNKKTSTVQASGIYKKNEKPILSVSY